MLEAVTESEREAAVEVSCEACKAAEQARCVVEGAERAAAKQAVKKPVMQYVQCRACTFMHVDTSILS